MTSHWVLMGIAQGSGKGEGKESREEREREQEGKGVDEGRGTVHLSFDKIPDPPLITATSQRPPVTATLTGPSSLGRWRGSCRPSATSDPSSEAAPVSCYRKPQMRSHEPGWQCHHIKTPP